MILLPLRPLGALAVVTLVAAPVRAQQTYALPESPAFSFLGVTPAEVARPASAHAFGTAVLNAIDPSGQVVQGLALDVAPWTYLPGVAITLEDYQRRGLLYALANTQLSLATARTAGDSMDTKLALGLRLTLFNTADPMADSAFTNELRRRMAKCDPDGFPDEADLAQQKVCVGEVNRAFREEWQRERWNGASLGVAAAGGWRLDASRLDSAAANGAAVWVTGGIPLGSSIQMLGQLRYDARAGDGEEGLSFGGRGFYGTPSRHGFVEIVGGTRTSGSKPSWTAGFEFRAAEGLWLSTGFGARGDPVSGDQRSVVIADLRWNIDNRPRILGAP